RTREKETDEEYGYIFEPDLTFYSTDFERAKPIYASAIAKDYAEKYGASEKTLLELIAYDKNALELLQFSAGKHSMQSIISALESLKKFKMQMDPEKFEKVIALIEANVAINSANIGAIAKGEEVKIDKAISEEEIEKRIDEYISSIPNIAEEALKNPKSINAIVGKVVKETGANAKIVSQKVKERLGLKT
ncbi:MAG: hypothetical protein ACP5SJ_01030, partial [Candidatus Micrarchaeia archaeon]